jgi:hypothetical protein
VKRNFMEVPVRIIGNLCAAEFHQILGSDSGHFTNVWRTTFSMKLDHAILMRSALTNLIQ